jgi:hypothetical protein
VSSDDGLFGNRYNVPIDQSTHRAPKRSAGFGSGPTFLQGEFGRTRWERLGRLRIGCSKCTEKVRWVSKAMDKFHI